MWKTGVCCGEYLKDNLNTGNLYVNQGKVNLCSCLIKKMVFYPVRFDCYKPVK